MFIDHPDMKMTCIIVNFQNHWNDHALFMENGYHPNWLKIQYVIALDMHIKSVHEREEEIAGFRDTVAQKLQIPSSTVCVYAQYLRTQYPDSNETAIKRTGC